MKKEDRQAIFIGDTTSWCHWGCTATSLGLRALIATHFDLRETLPHQAFLQLNSCDIPSRDIDCPRMLDDHIRLNKHLFDRIAKYPNVVMNGEGTLHGNQPHRKSILLLLFALQVRFGCRVHLVNHSAYPIDDLCPGDRDIEAYYKSIYNRLDYVAIRESCSWKVMNDLGVPSVLSFDCLPLYISTLFPELVNSRRQHSSKQPQLLIAGSSAMTTEGLAMFVNQVREWIASGIDVSVITGAKSARASDEDRFVRQVQDALPGLKIHNPTNLSDWVHLLHRADVLVTGRYHYLMAAAVVGTPIVSFEGNTPKVRALCDEFRLTAPLRYSDALAANEMRIRTRRILEGHHEGSVLSSDVLHQILDRSTQNLPGKFNPSLFKHHLQSYQKYARRTLRDRWNDATMTKGPSSTLGQRIRFVLEDWRKVG